MLKITAQSHLDHNLTTAQLAHVLATFRDRTGFFIETVVLPADLGTVPCALYGPSLGDDPMLLAVAGVRTAPRPGRPWPSRLVNLPPRPSRLLTVIAGPAGEDACVLYTAYGGPLAPQEPDDPNLDPRRIGPSMDFWAVHALADPAPEGTATPVDSATTG